MNADLDYFYDAALRFKIALNDSKSFNEIRKLWLDTSIPYSMGGLSPYSEEYLNIQLEIYRRLTGMDYSVSQELTSSKQSALQFERGYPWTSNNLEIVGSHLAKVAQALTALGSLNLGKEVLEVIEFGSGWGNLAIPIAKTGHHITCVDIDQGFLNRLVAIAAKESCELSIVNMDFIEAARTINNNRYDCVIFQSSFHHCIDFEELLSLIKKNLLNGGGVICFFAEPVHKDYVIPWGLRFDGESLWAIMCNSWMELGFSHEFFSTLLFRHGFFLTGLPGMGGMVGEGYVAVQCENGINFKNWDLPERYRCTWHIDDKQEGICFSKSCSVIPGLSNTKLLIKIYDVTIRNYSPVSLNVQVKMGDSSISIILMAGEVATLRLQANCDEVIFEVQTYIPNDLIKNGDTRELGFAIISVRAE
jgi:2-polyprenyl-3-methyl-5-hydroxy-6-metoxy-1,4-benzoquinol methylase